MKRLLLVLIALHATILSLAQGTVKLMPGATIQSRNKAYIVLNNMNLKNDGVIQFGAGQGIVSFTGSVNDSIQGSGLTSFDSLRIALSNAGFLTLSRNINVTAGIIFNSGLLNLDNSILDLGNTGKLFNESELNRAYTTGTGYIQATSLLNAPSSANPGNLGAIISSSTNLGSTIIRRGHAQQTGVGPNNSINRYFDILPTNNKNINATLRLKYFDAELGNISESSMAIWRSTNTAWTVLGSNSADTIVGYVEKNNIQTFTRMTLAGGCPTITVNIPDVYAVNPGGTINTIYKGYGPSSITLKAQVIGGNSPYTFKWTAQSPNGSIIGTDSILSVSPLDSTTYYVTVSDLSGCSAATVAKTIKVKDVRCGKNLDMVTICQKQANGSYASNCVAASKVSGYLSGGSYLGACLPVPPTIARLNTTVTEQSTREELAVKALPNPSENYFTLLISSGDDSPVTLEIVDILGRLVERKEKLSANTRLVLGSNYRPGVYIVRVVQAKQMRTLKLIKQSN